MVQDGLLSRFLLSLLIVMLIPIVFSKLHPFLNKKLQFKKRKSLSDLIQDEMLKFGRLGYLFRKRLKDDNSYSTQTSQKEQKVFEIYQNYYKENPTADLLKTLELMSAIRKNKTSYLRPLETAIYNLTHTKVPLREIANIGKELLYTRVLLRDPFINRPATYSEVKRLILSRLILELLFQDLKNERSLMTKKIERARNKSAAHIYLAFSYTMLLKLGGSEQKLLEQAMKNPNSLKLKVLNLDQDKIKTLLFSLCFRGGILVNPKQIFDLIKESSRKLETFKKTYFDNERKKQEQKSKVNKRPSETLSSAYEVLGCTNEDSTGFIKKSYRKLALKYHPDKYGDHEKFLEIREAYDKVLDSRKRKAS